MGHKPCYLNSFSSALTSAQIPHPLCTLWWHSDWNTFHMSPCPNGHYCSRIPEGYTRSTQEKRLSIKRKRRNLYLSLLQRILPFSTAWSSLPRTRFLGFVTRSYGWDRNAWRTPNNICVGGYMINPLSPTSKYKFSKLISIRFLKEGVERIW